MIHLQNLLSFGKDAKPIPLGPLNALTGANGSGKSNLIEAIGLIKAMPKTDGFLKRIIDKGGGIQEWLWKRGNLATLQQHLPHFQRFLDVLRHHLT